MPAICEMSFRKQSVDDHALRAGVTERLRIDTALLSSVPKPLLIVSTAVGAR